MGCRRLAWLALIVVVGAGCGGVTVLDDGGADAESDVSADESMGRPVTAVAAGSDYTCAITNSQVWCWGAAPYDVVAFDNSLPHPTPVERTDVPPSKTLCASVAGDQDHVCAVTTSGDVYCWGANLSGQLGNGTTSNDGMAPAKVDGVSGVTSVACGDDFTCALTEGGNVFCWGNDQVGELGDGTPDGGAPPPHDGGAPFPNETAVPVSVTGLSNVTGITAGWDSACAVASGDVWCWGLDLATSAQYHAPVQQPNLHGVTSVAVGEGTACAVAAGSVYCWGNGAGGQLGNGALPPNPTDTPVEVVGVSNAISVSMGAITGCATTGGGDVWCWGDNTFGQLGNGTVGGFQATPARLDVSNATTVSSGWDHGCAITSSGLMCWGNGVLDDGGTALSPTLVSW